MPVVDTSVSLHNDALFNITQNAKPTSDINQIEGLEALAKSKENFTVRGHLEALENALTDMVSELKYHRQQVQIISAEKDTSAAVAQMNIA